MSFENKILSGNAIKKDDIGILLAVAEEDVKNGRTKNARAFLTDFKQRARNLHWEIDKESIVVPGSTND